MKLKTITALCNVSTASYVGLAFLSFLSTAVGLCIAGVFALGIMVVNRQINLNLWQYVAIFAGICIAQAITTIGIQTLQCKATETNAKHIKLAVMSAAFRRNILDDRHTATFFTRGTIDADAVAAALPVTFTTLCGELLGILTATAICLFFSWNRQL